MKDTPLSTVAITYIAPNHTTQQPQLSSHSGEFLEIDGLKFKDLNHDGQLDVYEDWRKSPAERAAHLTSLLPLKDKIGLLFHATLENADENNQTYDLINAKKTN